MATDAHEHHAAVLKSPQNRNVDDPEERVRTQIQFLQGIIHGHHSRGGSKAVELDLDAARYRTTQSLLRPLNRDLKRTEKQAAKLLLSHRGTQAPVKCETRRSWHVRLTSL